jgi:protein O-mannosyl-transferase
MDKKRAILLILLLIAATAASYLPVTRAGFVNWDDTEYVINNRAIRDLSWHNTAGFFSAPHFSYYQPFVLLSYALEYRFFKLDAGAYHLTNLLLHAANCLLVLWLVFLLSGDGTAAFAAALLFALHPLHVESVAWVSERKDVLFAFFYLSSAVAYLYYCRKRSYYLYFLSLALFLCSLLSKSVALTLPLVLFLFDYLLERKPFRLILAEKIPFLALAAVFGCLAVVFLRSSGGMQARAQGIAVNIPAAADGIVFYLAKTVVPLKLSCLYPPPEITKDAFSRLARFSPVILPVLCLLVFYSRRYGRKIIFGCLFFLAALLPALQLIPVPPGVPADRFAYIPSIGLFFIAGEYFSLLLRKASGLTWRPVLPAGLLLAALALSALTYKRCLAWENSMALWNDVLAKYPSMPRAYLNRALAFKDNGDLDSAIADYDTAIRIYPAFAGAYNNRGFAYCSKGMHARAIEDFTAAIRLAPGFSPSYSNRGSCYYDLGRYGEALSDYESAAKLNPDSAEARAKIAELKKKTGIIKR